MKKIFIAFALFVSVLGVSCKKGGEPTPQPDTAIQKTINVEYVIQCPSGAATADYIAPDASGALVPMHKDITRNSESITFSCPTGNFLSISAANAAPSHNVIQVQIFVNGTKVAESSSTDPAQKAVAQGNF
ncbi:MAG: hypothetical protein ACXVPY_12025 [Bacteroidia bacterium]